MPSALQVARTGLDAQDTRMRVIANNLANVSHHRLQARPRQFRHARLSGHARGGSASSTQTNFATGLNLGTGVGVQGTTRVEAQGTLNTGNALDLAIQGNGYFQILLPSGQLSYTRAGNFSMSAEGQIPPRKAIRCSPPSPFPRCH
jgi:flagellar basal-body rod protein FlgG